MLNFFIDILIKTGEFVATSSNIGCFFIIFGDEPKCPKSLIS